MTPALELSFPDETKLTSAASLPWRMPPRATKPITETYSKLSAEMGRIEGHPNWCTYATLGVAAGGITMHSFPRNVNDVFVSNLAGAGRRMTHPLRLFAALLMAVASLGAATPCSQPHEIQPAETLTSIAASQLGSSRYAISIALATNARTADGFPYIANPDDLSGVSRVCIPAKQEARELGRAWAAYASAVDLARLPRAANLSSNLVTIPLGQPVDLVAWVRKDQTDRLKTPSGSWIETATSETWVTVEPHLQSFCREYVRSQKPDEAKLTRRLEQRLGLSPASGKTSFVRIRLSLPKPETIFRPCTDPAADQANCALGPPAKAPPAHQQWLFQQYYSSYGQSLIGEFPWTALGYTFDWAPGPAGGFQRSGETEFVIRRNAPLRIEEVLDTTQYCAPAGS